MRHQNITTCLFLCVVALCFSGCDYFYRHLHGEIVVRVGASVLYLSELDEVTRSASSPSDSARLADAYIAQWTSDAVIYEQVRLSDTEKRRIEDMVEAYRKNLYVQAYEAYLVSQEMPKHIEEDSVALFYETHLSHFVLQEAIVRGVLMVVPNEAPDKKRLRAYLERFDSTTIENTDLLEEIEKYAYRNATGYELFTEQWHNASDILRRIPIEMRDFEKMLRGNPLIEVSDSVSTYLLRVTDKYLSGEAMPLEYARPAIEKQILEERQLHFLQQRRRVVSH